VNIEQTDFIKNCTRQF